MTTVSIMPVSEAQQQEQLAAQQREAEAQKAAQIAEQNEQLAAQQREAEAQRAALLAEQAKLQQVREQYMPKVGLTPTNIAYEKEFQQQLGKTQQQYERYGESAQEYQKGSQAYGEKLSEIQKGISPEFSGYTLDTKDIAQQRTELDEAIRGLESYKPLIKNNVFIGSEEQSKEYQKRYETYAREQKEWKDLTTFQDPTLSPLTDISGLTGLEQAKQEKLQYEQSLANLEKFNPMFMSRGKEKIFVGSESQYGKYKEAFKTYEKESKDWQSAADNLVGTISTTPTTSEDIGFVESLSNLGIVSKESVGKYKEIAEKNIEYSSPPPNVVEVDAGGYGSGTSRTVYLNGQPYGDIQIPEGYEGRDQEYIKSTYGGRGFKIRSEVSDTQYQRALQTAQGNVDADRAAHQAYNEEQARLLSGFMGGIASGEIRASPEAIAKIGLEGYDVSKAISAQPFTLEQFKKSELGAYGERISPKAEIAAQIEASPLVSLKPPTQAEFDFTGKTIGEDGKIIDRTLPSFPFYPSQKGSIAEKYAELPYNKFGIEDYSSIKLYKDITNITTPFKEKISESTIIGDIGKTLDIGALKSENVQKFIKGVAKSPASVIEFGATIPAVGEFIIKEPSKIIPAVASGLPIVAKGMYESAKEDPFGFGGEFLGQALIFGGGAKSISKLKSKIETTVGIQKPVGILVEMGETPVFEIPKSTKTTIPTGDWTTTTEPVRIPLYPAKDIGAPRMTSARAQAQVEKLLYGEVTPPEVVPRMTYEEFTGQFPKVAKPVESNTFLENVGGRGISKFVEKVAKEDTTKIIEPQLLVGETKTRMVEIKTPEVFMGERLDFGYKVSEKVAQTYYKVPKEKIPEFLKAVKGEVKYIKTPEGSYMVVKGAKPKISETETTPDFNILQRKLIEGGVEFPTGKSTQKISFIEKIQKNLPRIEKKETLRPAQFVEQTIFDRPQLSAMNFDVYAEGKPVTPKGKPMSPMNVMPEKIVNVGGKTIFEGSEKITGTPEMARLTPAKPQELIFIKEKLIPKDFETQFLSTEEIMKKPESIKKIEKNIKTFTKKPESVESIASDIQNLFGKPKETRIEALKISPQKIVSEFQPEKSIKTKRVVQTMEQDTIFNSIKDLSILENKFVKNSKEKPFEFYSEQKSIPKFEQKNIKIQVEKNISPTEKNIFFASTFETP